METIRILLYTDYANISENKHSWGLTDLERFVKLKIKGIANVEFCIRNRHFDYENNKPNINGATRLTWELLCKYHELWVFGALQVDTPEHPHNELDKEEVDVLCRWMKKGGVLITGDHSQKMEGMTCRSDHKAFINIGAALGRHIPRAGQLRVWEGPPTGCYIGPLAERDNYNTNEGDDPLQLDEQSLQTDRLPQTLRLTQGRPHRLFWWYFDPDTQEVVPICKLPDHIHEGKLTIPSKLEGDWPAEFPRPIVVAQGRDKRFTAEERLYDLVVAYDGDSVDVGRIVADSSFHHYINRNLVNVPARENLNPKPGTFLDQIAQYYCNLALWLAPKEIRARIIWGLFFEAASHPDVLEDKGNSIEVMGKSALSALEFEIGTSNLYRLLAPSEYESESSRINDFLAPVFLGGKSPSRLSNIKPEIVLGYIVQEYHDFFEQEKIIDPGWLERDPAQPDVVVNGLRKAFENQASEFEGFASEFREVSEKFRREHNDEQEALWFDCPDEEDGV